MRNFSADLHRKGELNKVAEMEKLAKRLERNSQGGLTPAFLTKAYKGFDCYAMLATKPSYEHCSGYVLFDEDTQKAEFIYDETE